jgi:hypothetical protein
VIVRNPAALPATTEFAKLVHAVTTLAGRKPLVEYNHLSGVAFLLTAELKWLLNTTGIIPKEARQEISAASLENEAFVFGVRRSKKAAVYILVGDNKDALQSVERQFAASDKPFVGVAFATRRARPVENIADKIAPPIPPVSGGDANELFVERAGADPGH